MTLKIYIIIRKPPIKKGIIYSNFEMTKTQLFGEKEIYSGRSLIHGQSHLGFIEFTSRVAGQARGTAGCHCYWSRTTGQDGDRLFWATNRQDVSSQSKQIASVLSRCTAGSPGDWPLETVGWTHPSSFATSAPPAT